MKRLLIALLMPISMACSARDRQKAEEAASRIKVGMSLADVAKVTEATARGRWSIGTGSCKGQPAEVIGESEGVRGPYQLVVSNDISGRSAARKHDVEALVDALVESTKARCHGFVIGFGDATFFGEWIVTFSVDDTARVASIARAKAVS